MSRQADRQAGRQAGRQEGRQVSWYQTNGQLNRENGRLINKWKDNSLT